VGHWRCAPSSRRSKQARPGPCGGGVCGGQGQGQGADDGGRQQSYQVMRRMRVAAMMQLSWAYMCRALALSLLHPTHTVQTASRIQGCQRELVSARTPKCCWCVALYSRARHS
jgi:hypothetical protein